MDPLNLAELARSYPDVATQDDGEQLSYSVLVKGKAKGVCWQWRERVDPKKARVINPLVYAFRTSSLEAKEILLADAYWGSRLFTEPHYANYPAVLARLADLSYDDLKELFDEALAACQKSKKK